MHCASSCAKIGHFDLANIVLLLVAKLANNHNTTQNTTHILHNNQNNEPPPYPQRLRPLSPWVEQRRPQVLAPPLPNAIRRSRAVGLARDVVGSLIWGGKMIGIEKYRGGGASALGGRGWPPFSSHDATTNRMIVSAVGGALEIRRGRVATCREDVFPPFGATNWDRKK
jgi:hypothetical protein